MPISADPSSTIPYVLITDRLKPKDSQTVFHLRFLTDREVSRYDRVADQYDASKDDEERAKLANELLHTGIVRWERLNDPSGKPITHSRDFDLTTVLSPGEKLELVRAVREEPFLRERDLKNSVSPAPSAPASSVVTASADASIAPAVTTMP